MTRPSLNPRPRIAIIGAGLSGLTCARTLLDHGNDMTVFEKSRGAGGRMATRRTPRGDQFDHGAQYFTVRDPRFRHAVESWIDEGVAEAWQCKVGVLTDGQLTLREDKTIRFVGVAGMNAICRHLAAGVNIQFSTLTRPPVFEEGAWRLSDSQGRDLGQFDYVISSAPAPQSGELLTAAPELQRCALMARMRGCWAVMLTLTEMPSLPYDAAFVHDSKLSWIARNDSKPGRKSEGETWVLHASPEWSEAHLEDASSDVLTVLIDAFWQATGVSPRRLADATSHRWRYAIPSEPLESPSLFDPKLRIGACGDWCGGPRVEGAFLSGRDLAEQVLTRMKGTSVSP